MLASTLGSLLVGVAAPDEHPVRHDRTGIEWQLPFSEAVDEARAQQRLLVIKPVAFGTTPDGCW